MDRVEFGEYANFPNTNENLFGDFSLHLENLQI